MTNYSITVTAVGAQLEKDIETIGKQDPYLRASVDLNDDDSYQKTFTDKNAGKTPHWNQSFTFELNGEPDIFIEIMDEEKGIDAIIGFAAIPISQAVDAPHAAINGQFNVFDYKGNITGQVNLILQAHGFNNSSNVQPEDIIDGQSYLNEDQKARAKKIHRKEIAGDVGTAAAALLGGVLLGKTLYDKHKEKNAEGENEEVQEE
ncbi:hypothetical protein BJ944DRAFT_258229 [Cunninghamella echinulata]|nr:hypothetical protein BJ944DRAFT_258229 [Cunninghamella echinulata]